MGHQLHIETGKLKGFSIPVEEGATLTIGRAAGCDLRIREDGVSRTHCRLEQRNGVVELRDLGSANGTLINGERTTLRQLGDGDELRIGSVVLRYRRVDDTAKTKPTGPIDPADRARVTTSRRRGPLATGPLPSVAGQRSGDTDVDALLMTSTDQAIDRAAIDHATLDRADIDRAALEATPTATTDAPTTTSDTPTLTLETPTSDASNTTEIPNAPPAPPAPEAPAPPVPAALRNVDTVLADGDLGLRPAVQRRYGGARSVAITATQLYQPDEAQRRLETLYGLSALLVSERSLELLLDGALAAVLEVSGADRAAIVLASEADALAPVALRTRDGQPDHGFRLSRTIVDQALVHGVSVLSSDAAKDERFRQEESVLIQRVRSVMCAPLSAQERIIGAIYLDSTDIATAFEERDLELLAAVGQQIGAATDRARLIDDLENLFVGAMLTLTASIEAKDAYTRGHSERVTIYSLMLADALGVTGPQRDVVELGGLLHDVGKIGIPEAVLRKPGALDDDEFALMKQHPELGEGIVANMPELDRLVNMAEIVAAVRHHHEKFDGQGYPDGLAGEAIPLAARILAVADTYDAITTDRPYRKGCAREVALRILQANSGSQFDPRLVQAFVGIVGGEGPPSLASVRGRFRVTRLG
jgi:HD-GYP domain-containing protein (c-di-GMP phosphodiesterase class II)/pSer/pThr/pTyr-binding forkhead associated (FHA) protein